MRRNLSLAGSLLCVISGGWILKEVASGERPFWGWITGIMAILFGGYVLWLARH